MNLCSNDWSTTRRRQMYCNWTASAAEHLFMQTGPALMIKKNLENDKNLCHSQMSARMPPLASCQCRCCLRQRLSKTR